MSCLERGGYFEDIWWTKTDSGVLNFVVCQLGEFDQELVLSIHLLFLDTHWNRIPCKRIGMALSVILLACYRYIDIRGVIQFALVCDNCGT